MTTLTVTSAQRALGFVSARHRGDAEGADLLMAEFDSEQERVLSFCLVAELSLVLLAEATTETFDDVVQRMGISLAALGESREA